MRNNEYGIRKAVNEIKRIADIDTELYFNYNHDIFGLTTNGGDWEMFFIDSRWFEDYLSIRRQKFEHMLDMYKYIDDIDSFADKQNHLTLQAIRMYRKPFEKVKREDFKQWISQYS